MEKADKIKIIQKAVKLSLDAEEKGMLIGISYFSPSQGLNLNARHTQDGEFLVWEHIWLSNTHYSVASVSLNRIFEKIKTYYK